MRHVLVIDTIDMLVIRNAGISHIRVFHRIFKIDRSDLIANAERMANRYRAKGWGKNMKVS